MLAGLGAYRLLVPSVRRRGRLTMASRLIHDAALYAKQGDAASAGALLDRALAVLSALEPEAHPAAGPILVNLAQLGSRLAHDDRGPARQNSALVLAQAWYGPDAAESLAVLAAVAALHLGRPGEASLAVERYQAGYESVVRASGRDATQTVYWSSMTAHALWLAGRLGDAEGMFREVVRVVEAAPDLDADHLWRARCQVAAVVEAQGRFAEARETLSAAVARLQTAQPVDRAGLSEHLGRLGWLHFELAAYGDAEACFKRALSLGQHSGEEQALELTHRAKAQLAVLYSQLARFDEAQIVYEELVSASTAFWTDVSNFAEAQMMMGRPADARALFDRALAAAERERVPESDLRDTLRALGDLCVRDGRLEDAERAYARAIAGAEKAHGRDHPGTAAAIGGLAGLRLAQGRLEEAEALGREALELRERWLGSAHPDVGAALFGLGLVLEARAAREPGGAARLEAAAMHLRALTIRRAVFAVNHPAIVESHAAVARLEGDA